MRPTRETERCGGPGEQAAARYRFWAGSCGCSEIWPAHGKPGTPARQPDERGLASRGMRDRALTTTDDAALMPFFGSGRVSRESRENSDELQSDPTKYYDALSQQGGGLPCCAAASIHRSTPARCKAQDRSPLWQRRSRKERRLLHRWHGRSLREGFESVCLISISVVHPFRISWACVASALVSRRIRRCCPCASGMLPGFTSTSCLLASC